MILDPYRVLLVVPFEAIQAGTTFVGWRHGGLQKLVHPEHVEDLRKHCIYPFPFAHLYLTSFHPMWGFINHDPKRSKESLQIDPRGIGSVRPDSTLQRLRVQRVGHQYTPGNHHGWLDGMATAPNRCPLRETMMTPGSVTKSSWTCCNLQKSLDSEAPTRRRPLRGWGPDLARQVHRLIAGRHRALDRRCPLERSDEAPGATWTTTAERWPKHPGDGRDGVCLRSFVV